MPPLQRPFALPRPAGLAALRLTAAGPIAAIEEALGLSRLNRLYARWLAERDRASGRFVDRALDILGISYEVVDNDLRGLPSSGSVIVAANHPHGAVDGLILASLVGAVREDVRLLGNYLLAQIPEVRPFCIFVDPFGERTVNRRNLSGLREAAAWLEQGGALVVFPAGGVAHRRALHGEVVEGAWHPSVARLAERTGSCVVPVHISGANSWLFQTAGLLHPWLRTALLARELLAQRGCCIRVRVGDPVAWSDLERRHTPRERTAYLRLRTLGLAPAGAAGRALGTGASPTIRVRRLKPVAAPVPASHLTDDIDGLDPSRVLLETGDLRVICAPAPELPQVLTEIGRLRESTFRAAGEGTGKACDLDAYDRRYRHLFVWNARTREIAGAYRLGPTDVVGARWRPRRLYTRSLFRFGRPLLSRLGPALELGRSFVREEYQRDYATLMLLWKGIGHFVARHPDYRMLFGPVSISAEYTAASRELVVAALSTPRYQSSCAALVRARRPPDVAPLSAWMQKSGAWQGIDALNQLVSSLEPDGKGLPVLLRQYLKLNAKLMAFSVDPDFGHVIDGLMVVDLLDVDRPVLNRYMGRDGAAGFLAHHRRSAPRTADAQQVAASA